MTKREIVRQRVAEILAGHTQGISNPDKTIDDMLAIEVTDTCQIPGTCGIPEDKRNCKGISPPVDSWSGQWCVWMRPATLGDLIPEGK